MAVDLIEEMCKAGLNVSAETFHPILHACERTNELELVPLTYAVMRNYGLQPTWETVKYVVNSFLKMKNFKAVYNLLEEMRELKIRPIVHLYNSIMAAYFRENNDSQAMAILKEVEDADLKPDAETYSCLIYHSKSLKTSEKLLKKKMKRLKIPPSKQVPWACNISHVVSCRGKRNRGKRLNAFGDGVWWEKAMPKTSLQHGSSLTLFLRTFPPSAQFSLHVLWLIRKGSQMTPKIKEDRKAKFIGTSHYEDIELDAASTRNMKADAASISESTNNANPSQLKPEPSDNGVIDSSNVEEIESQRQQYMNQKRLGL
ncbi:hypothetical protein SUGI_0312420 [Cryptomeria japonica]|nr:hypothetical protein SUGI_0312420 [Cryptomeria japonica]